MNNLRHVYICAPLGASCIQVHKCNCRKEKEILTEVPQELRRLIPLAASCCLHKAIPYLGGPGEELSNALENRVLKSLGRKAQNKPLLG